ncbi:unnamed protein product [Cyclocybe aegerita]|uniref:Uncharacterized protein n=1 Tax=Cyclocybe aegerita TaxID=1973307 RepID=A0A8S0W1I0_CYCAE|nr:unnamed protein product [Cyclocybe aegerita]
MPAFFENAKNVSIRGGTFNVVSGGMQVFDNSRHTTNIDSFNTRSSVVQGSHNDNSQRYHGTGPHLLPPSMGRDRPRSAGSDSGSQPIHPLPPPSAHPALMNPENMPPGSRTYTQDSFNTTNQHADNVHNNNSQEYGTPPPSERKKRKKKKKEAYLSEDEDNDTQMADENESEDDQRLAPPTTPPSNTGWDGYPPPPGDKGNPYARGALGRGYHPPMPYSYGHHPYPYPPPPPQPMYGYQGYGYPPPMPSYNSYPGGGYGGYQQQVSGPGGVYQMDDQAKRMFADTMNKAKATLDQDMAEIGVETGTRRKKGSASTQIQPAESDSDDDSDDSEPEEQQTRFVKKKRVPKAPRAGLLAGMERMSIDSDEEGVEGRPEFSRVKSDPPAPNPGAGAGAGADTGAASIPGDEPTTKTKKKTKTPKPQSPNSDPEIPPHQSAFAGFGGPPMPFGVPPSGAGMQPAWASAPPPQSSPFGPHLAAASGIPYNIHPYGYTQVDNSIHTSSFGSHNYSSNVTKDSHNDNSLKVTGSGQETTETTNAGYRREKPPKKQGPYQRS